MRRALLRLATIFAVPLVSVALALAKDVGRDPHPAAAIAVTEPLVAPSDALPPVSGRRGASAVALVRMWVAESGWRQLRDHAAQAWILRRWAERTGRSLPDAVGLRVWAFSRPPAWARRIGPRCEQPRGWPARWRWSAHEDDCRLLFARAEAFLRGELTDPCRGRALGWRSPGRALQVALSLGRKEVSCGRTAVRFVR